MRRILATAALMLAWLCANGALLDAVQVVAWSRMFAGYSDTMTVSAALRETFNPAKPCALCRHVAKARETAQRQLPPVGDTHEAAPKLVLALETSEPPLFAPEPGAWTATPRLRGCVRTEPVPVPPPRA